MPTTVKRQSAAVMFTDIAGYTSIMASDEEKALSLLQEKRQVLKPLIDKHDGVYVKGTGDGTLSYFDSAYKASKCAKLFQESIYENKNMNVRIGIHVGDIVIDDGDVYGDGVNVASRLESMSPVGGICVSNTVYDELRNKKEFDGIELGLQSLKGVGRLIEIYGLKGDLLTEPKPGDYQDNKVAVHSDDEVPSIAIIPFDNKGAEEDIFYAYGIFSDLISDCSNAGLIRVASLKNIEILDYKILDTTELASKLFIRYVATGTLWKMDEIFQLSVELYDTKESKVVWSDRWEENWENLTTIKDILSDGLLKALSTNPKVNNKVETTNIEAYEYYLKGCYKWNLRNSKEEGLVAIGLLEKAVELDANLFDAKNLLATAIFVQGDVEKSLKLFDGNIKQASLLNDNYSFAKGNLSKGWVLWEESKYEKALESYSNALPFFEDLNKKGDIIQTLHAIGFVYTCLGLSDKAIDIFMQAKALAEEIQDNSKIDASNNLLGIEYTFAKRYDEALTIFLNQLSSVYSRDYRHYRAWIHCNIGITYFLINEYHKAAEYFKIAYDIHNNIGKNSDAIWALSWLMLSEMKMDKLKQTDNLNLIHKKINEGWLKDIDYPEVNYILFRIYNELGDSDKSKLHLEIAYNRLIEISNTIINQEYKKSFLKARFHNEIVETWEQNN